MAAEGKCSTYIWVIKEGKKGQKMKEGEKKWKKDRGDFLVYNLNP